MINAYCKKLKYRRKIILVTNGEGLISSDGLDEIIKKVKSDNIELVILYAFCPCSAQSMILSLTRGVDFDDPEYGFKEEDKDPAKVIMLCNCELLRCLIY
jgi:ATP-dependent DNA helicase 2 subunit 2